MVSKVHLAEEVMDYIEERGGIPGDRNARQEMVLDIQDIFSRYWDEEEVEG